MKRAVLIVFSVLAFLISVPVLIGGAVLTAIGATGDNVDFALGHVQSSGNAVVSDAVDVYWDGPFADRFEPAVVVDSGDSSEPIFIGIGPTSDVDQYLTGVPQTLVYGLGGDMVNRDVEVPGTASPEPPGDQGFWVAQSSGAGEQRLVLPALDGSYRFAIMNVDGSAGVAAAVSGSVAIPFLIPIGVGAIVFGVMVLLVAILLLVLGIRAKPSRAMPGTSAPSSGYPAATVPYPQPPVGAAGAPYPSGQAPEAPPAAPEPGWPPEPQDRLGP